MIDPIGPTLVELPSSTHQFDHSTAYHRLSCDMETNPLFSSSDVILTTSQSQLAICTTPLQGSSLPQIVQLSLNQPPIPLQPSMSEVTSSHASHSFPILGTTHMWTPTALLGHPILPSNNVVSSVVDSGPITSSMFLLSTNQTNNPFAITQPTQRMNIQVRTILVPLSRGEKFSMGQNPCMRSNLCMGQKPGMGPNPIMGSTPTMGPNPIMGSNSILVQTSTIGQHPSMIQNPTTGQNPTMGQPSVLGK